MHLGGAHLFLLVFFLQVPLFLLVLVLVLDLVLPLRSLFAIVNFLFFDTAILHLDLVQRLAFCSIFFLTASDTPVGQDIERMVSCTVYIVFVHLSGSPSSSGSRLQNLRLRYSTEPFVMILI